MHATRLVILWIFIGLIGSGAIGFLAISSIESQSFPRIQSGGLVLTSFWDRGYVIANGTWVIEGSKQASPRQTTEIKCSRDEKECLSAQAEITFGGALSVYTERLPITTWDDNTIIFSSTEPTCVTYVYTIARASERLTGQRRPKQTAGELCKSLEQRVFNLTMRDGSQVWEDFRNEAESKIFPYMWAALGVWWAFVIYRISRRRLVNTI
jgi:hypothetical protein